MRGERRCESMYYGRTEERNIRRYIYAYRKKEKIDRYHSEPGERGRGGRKSTSTKMHKNVCAGVQCTKQHTKVHVKCQVQEVDRERVVEVVEWWWHSAEVSNMSLVQIKNLI